MENQVQRSARWEQNTVKYLLMRGKMCLTHFFFLSNMPVAMCCIYTAPLLFTAVCLFKLKKHPHCEDISNEHKFLSPLP